MADAEIDDAPTGTLTGTDQPAEGRAADWVAPFLAALFTALDGAGLRWVVLRNHQDLPDRAGHDVDVIVHPADASRVDPLIREVVTRQDLALLRAYAGIEHETFDVAASDLRGRLLLHVDFQTAVRYRGRLLVDADDLLAHTRAAPTRGGAPLRIPEPAMEAYALLLHAALHKAALKAKYADRLAELRDADPGGLERLASERLGPATGARLAAVRDEAGLLAVRPELRRALLRRYPANPIRQAWFRMHSGTRQTRLRLWPRGVFAAFLGPDGSGKSSLTDLLVERLGGHEDVLKVHRVYMGSGQPLLPTRKVTRRLHGKTGPKAASKPAMVRDISPRRLRGPLHVMADEILRYWVHIRPRLAPHGVVLVDRYAYDILRVNNRTVQRPWFRRLAVAIIPSPQVTFFLEGNPEVITARKRELTVAETTRQLHAYRKLAAVVPNFRPVELAVRDDQELRGVAREVLGVYARRNRGLVPW
jgi:thymidylate kinase